MFKSIPVLNSVATRFSPQYESGLGLVLLISGLFGFVIGAIGYVDWQVAVETSQVVAGIVQYPANNAFYMYHTKLWTIIHQVTALLLNGGVSEVAASILLSGLLGMLSLQAFAVIILALSRDWLLAVGGAVAVFFTRPNEFGQTYPVFFAGTSHTYGIMGMSYMMLVIGLLGGGWRRLGGVLLGMAPAVHPSLGFWLGVMVGLCCLWDIRHFRENWLPWLKYFLIGGAITTVSMLIQIIFIQDVPKATPANARDIFLAFITFWDLHRQPVAWQGPGFILNAIALPLSLLWLFLFKNSLPRQSILLLRALVIMAVLSLLAVPLTWRPPDQNPETFLILMPARILNFATFASLPVLIGVIGVFREKAWSWVLLLLLLTGLLFGGGVVDNSVMLFTSRFWQLVAEHGVNLGKYSGLMIHSWYWMTGISIALTTAAAFSIWGKKPAKTPKTHNKRESKNTVTDPVTPAPIPPRVLLQRLSWAMLGIIALLTVWLVFKIAPDRSSVFQDWRNNAVFAEASKGKGILLTGGDLHLIQLRTRRPVLMDGGGLDGLAYNIESAALMRQVLQEVYRIDLFTPPEEAYCTGAVPPQANRQAWSQLPLEFWQAIKEKYNVTEVLTPVDWSIQLPCAIKDAQHALYRIPEKTVASANDAALK